MINFILGVSITINAGFVTAILMFLNFKKSSLDDEAITNRELYEEFFNDRKLKK